jgi:hypothetical protein
MCLLRSGDPSVHHTGPRSPSFFLATSTAWWAADSAVGSPAIFADRTALRALISSLTSVDRKISGRSGLASRQSLPRTTKYRPSGVTGCLSPAIRRAACAWGHSHSWLRGRGSSGFPGARHPMTGLALSSGSPVAGQSQTRPQTPPQPPWEPKQRQGGFGPAGMRF